MDFSLSDSENEDFYPPVYIGEIEKLNQEELSQSRLSELQSTRVENGRVDNTVRRETD